MNNQLNPSCREALYPQTDGRKHFTTMTGKECGGDAKGLAGLPQVEVEVPEGYFSSWGGVPSEKYGVKTPTLVPQPTSPETERNPDNIQL